MRIVEKVPYGFGGLLALILLFVALCHYNPTLASQIGGSLKAEAGVKPVEDFDSITVTVNHTTTVGELPAAEGAQSTSAKDTSDDTEEDQLRIPGKVAVLNGYIPVKATGTEITQNKADEIAGTLGKGATGDDLTFDGRIYPYYEMLNDTQKALYRQIFANAQAQNRHFAPVVDSTANDLKNAFTSVVNDHPELFWVDTAYKYKYTPKGSVADITLVFNITANNLEQSKIEFEAGAKFIKDETYGKYTAYEREKAVHDALLDNVIYDANAPMNQSAYSALVYGRTVCAGYARAFQYVLQQLDIPCYYVTGYAGENHAWNIVKLDDGYYNVDSTWDDTNPSTYDYFNCSDADYASDHMRKDLSIYLPPCDGNKYRDLEVNPKENSDSTNPAEESKPTPSKPSSTTTTTNNTTTTNTTTTNNTNTTNTTTTSATQNESITVMTVRGGGDQNYISNIDDYFNECFAAMIDNDNSKISFDLIVTDKKLWDKIYKAYDKGDCQEGYIDRYLVEKHKNACSMSVEAVPRTDGSYLLRHSAVIK